MKKRMYIIRCRSTQFIRREVKRELMKENPVRDVTIVTRINDTNIVRRKDKAVIS